MKVGAAERCPVIATIFRLAGRLLFGYGEGTDRLIRLIERNAPVPHVGSERVLHRNPSVPTRFKISFL